jgi:hypothetical protein
LLVFRETSSASAAVSGTDPGLFLRAVEFALLFLFHLNRLLSLFLPAGLMKAMYYSTGYFTYYAFPPMRRRLDDIATVTSGDRDKDIRSVMGEVAAAAESMIRDAPGQWMSWFGIRGLWGQERALEERVG